MADQKTTNVAGRRGTDSIGVFDYDSPIVIEVDANGVILPVAHQNGLTVIVPRWPFPAPVGSANLLNIYLNEDEVFQQNYPSPLTEPDYRPIIAPEFFAVDGTYRLHYETITDGNIAYSGDRVLSVRRTPPVVLIKPVFPSANLWGYLNCKSTPKLWEVVIVRIPVPKLVDWIENDELRLEWAGYASLNGSGPALFIHELKKVLTPQEVVAGYDFWIDDYVQYVKPLEKNASALAIYSIYRNGVLIAKSSPGLVKVDRLEPGEEYSCGP
ncbi:hypothetical protein ATI02_6333 [Pseudomonas baetica]|uniref:Uncharacterized protein n=1 Tax=Pseudomonas baetica TaxID=674054 RepID=A0ABX4Q8U8_9PSED|nr:hypothetical protein [Pseudomonas baetica]PKA73211.1 hypothetical protein ATI02_6333 [Pseudomonas baetica]PTC18924.1 hypothetical protein C0J26_15080 [Pseudomonas baetica]